MKLIKWLAKIAYPLFVTLISLIAIVAIIVWEIKIRQFNP
jgi:hypothetical protein